MHPTMHLMSSYWLPMKNWWPIPWHTIFIFTINGRRRCIPAGTFVYIRSGSFGGPGGNICLYKIGELWGSPGGNICLYKIGELWGSPGGNICLYKIGELWGSPGGNICLYKIGELWGSSFHIATLTDIQQYYWIIGILTEIIFKVLKL